MSLEEKLDKIRSPKLQNQRETAIVLSAVEDTLKDQQCGSTPTAYFVALLALLSQSISSSKGVVNKELATSVVYLLDVVTPYVPTALLRSKFSQILTSIAPVLSNRDIEAPLLKSSVGCLESVLIAQDSAAWSLPQAQISPRRAIAGLLILASDHRPKVRKRAQDAITQVLKIPPPSPSLDHPAADICAETAMRNLHDIITASEKNKRKSKNHVLEDQHQPALIHALQLIKTIASASGGWPSKKIEPLCEILMNISKSSNNYLTMTAFEVFETMFSGMADQLSSSKLPRLMEAITELRPLQNDSQLLPPWIAVLSRGYEVSAQVNPSDTFQRLPEIFGMISGFLLSSSHNIRVSASECLISFLVNCIPKSVVFESSIFDEKILEKIVKVGTDLLSVKYQAGWMEVFKVLCAIFDALKWKSVNLTNEIIALIGELRSNDSFNGKKEADIVLGQAITAVGPDVFLTVLPLNLANPKVDQPGRAWLLPLLRDHVGNTNLSHFKSEFVPLSETMYQRVIEHGPKEMTMEIKIFETLVQQIWGLLPGYCDAPLDLVTAFDQSFAELLANLLYKQTELRPDICKSLQALVDTNQEVLSTEQNHAHQLQQRRLTREEAQKNINHLSTFTGNLLAVLFNVYSETLPQFRGYILQCVNAYLSITPEKELLETFTRVTAMLESALAEAISQTQADKQRQKQSKLDKMPPTSHTLMDLIITVSIYLPQSSFPALFSLATEILPQTSDPQLQKKAYKLFPRLAASPKGILALQERNLEFQSLLLNSASTTTAPCRRDRLDALAVVVEHLPTTSLHFIPSVLAEVVISAKEVNEKARTAAFDLLVSMAQKMSLGGTIIQHQIPHMPLDAPHASASLEEFFTMVSAGLVGSTPHMVSASIIALTRILYEFHAQLPAAVIEDLVSTMDLFLTSPNREIVRSVFGFVKVVIISLPEDLVKPRLETLIKGLISWSHEHKAQFRAKVKHIFERMIRRFGFEIVEKYCPEDDKKFVHNIRKAKERQKRKKDAGNNEKHEEARSKRKSRFESEYDKAIYGSDESTEEGSDIEIQDDGVAESGNTYIVEDPDEPLDLLSRKAFGHISSTKPHHQPLKSASRLRNQIQTNPDGKFIFGPDADDDIMVIDTENGGKDDRDGQSKGSLEAGINAYVDAIRGRDAVQRGRGGRLKFSNRREKEGRADDEGVDDEKKKSLKGEKARERERERSGKGTIGGRRGGGMKGQKQQRRGLGVGKVRDGRVGKGKGGVSRS